ncbi:hypothetical protein [Bacillus halotolerans]|uniref:hypothetical protein n=1 Tax=Bacillus halotolerans TaxID=260554 RepID=UPI00404B2E84
MKDLLFAKSQKVLLDMFKVKKGEFIIQNIICGIALAIPFLIISFLLKVPLLALGSPLLFMIGYRIPYLSLLGKKYHIDTIKYYSFPKFLRNFINFSETQGNVYKTFEAILPYTENPIKDEVVKLMAKLNDPRCTLEDRREAFFDFGKFVGTPEAFLVINTISNFDQEGINREALEKLEDLVQNLQNNKTNEYIHNKVKAQEKFANVPIISGLCFTFFFTGIIIFYNFVEGFSQVQI